MLFQDKTILVTGGSSGLGLHLAQAFAQQGAFVYLLAREQDRLAKAVKTLAGSHAGRMLVADVTSNESVVSAMQQVAHERERVDVLVNAAGVSHRSSILDVTPEQFQSAWDLNFLGVVRCVRAASTHARLMEPNGRIVMIGSLASKVTAPFLGAYPASKFALAAYTQQLRLEWEPRGVRVLLVCPGPIRREDAGSRYDALTANLPDSARQPGGGAPLSALDPEWLSQRIVSACHRGDAELVVPGKVRFLAALSHIAPRWVEALVRRKTMRGA